MTKVSVIVAAYCAGPELDHVVASLDAQSMPQDEFESIFVDDGSPDDTLERLRAFAATRPNMRVTSIPNSGWPSRPRNVAIEMAVGEYVTFMDDDDELYPDALRDAYEFAVTHDVDVVNAKECPTAGWAAAFRQMQEDRVTGPDPEALLAMMPHKLYRRALLEKHGIRFLDAGRVLLEDMLFNLEVVAHSERVGVLASRPYYKYKRVAHGEHLSSSYGDDADEIWDAMGRLLDLAETLPLEPSARDFMVLHTYRLRVLTRLLGPRLLTRREEWRRRSFERAPQFLERYVPERFDADLGPLPRARAHLLRAGRFDLLTELAREDRGITADLVAQHVGWSADGDLTIAGEALWRRRDGEPWLVDRDGDRVVRQLPANLREALPPDALDVTEALGAAEVAVLVKSVEDSTDWTAPTEHQVHLEPAAGGHEVRVAAESRVSVDTVVFGRPLTRGTWKVGARVDMFGGGRQSAVLYDGPGRAALLAGRPCVAASRGGRLVLRVDTPLGAVLDSTGPDIGATRVSRTGPLRSSVTIPVRGLVVVGETRLALTAQLRPVAGAGWASAAPAELIADADGARLELTARVGLRPLRLSLEVAGPDGGTQTWLTPVVLRRDRRGRVTAERVPVLRAKARVWGRQLQAAEQGG